MDNGSWSGYMAYCNERGFAPDLNLGSETQPPDDFPMEDTEVPETEPLAMPTRNDDANPLDSMTLDQLLRAPGRDKLKKIDPSRMNGTTWYRFDKGFTKIIKKIMESDFSEPAPNITSVSGDTKKCWFKAFAQNFNWDYGLTGEVQEKFEEICGVRLLDYVYGWKKKWLNGKEKPKWMRENVWQGLIAYWLQEQNKSRSETNSQNRKSERGGYGMAKHTCGSMPYVRKKEKMRNPETGEYPDMVTFMEETHKRKSDGTFVDKKAEAIARRCREMEKEKLTQMSQHSDTPDDYQLTQAEKNDIFRSQVEVKKGRRFGFGSIPFDEDMGGSSSYSHAHVNCQENVAEIIELKTQLKDCKFWMDMMARLHPDIVPPSRQDQPGNQNETNNVDTLFDNI
ncbi:unnamed protein product [Arabidopsis lyrata]|nr:unnamed protein product [Arabidopsis lyrata]